VVWEGARRFGVDVRIAVDVVVGVTHDGPQPTRWPFPVIVDRVTRTVAPVPPVSNPIPPLFAIVEFRTMMFTVFEPAPEASMPEPPLLAFTLSVTLTLTVSVLAVTCIPPDPLFSIIDVIENGVRGSPRWD